MREIDALGGMMGRAADHHPLQIKMLNTGKGPGVQCLRAQVDKKGYPAYMQSLVLSTPNLQVKECQVKALLHDEKKVFGVVTDKGEEITAKAIIITTGTYMKRFATELFSIQLDPPKGQSNGHCVTYGLYEGGLFTVRTSAPYSEEAANAEAQSFYAKDPKDQEKIASFIAKWKEKLHDD